MIEIVILTILLCVVVYYLTKDNNNNKNDRGIYEEIDDEITEEIIVEEQDYVANNHNLVVEKDSMHELELEISRLIVNGWKRVGSVSTRTEYHFESGSRMRQKKVVFMQAMTRR